MAKRGAKPKGYTVCQICGDPQIAKALCWRHYQQARRAKQRPPHCPNNPHHAWSIKGNCLRCGAKRTT